MDTSVGEQASTNIGSDNNATFSQGIVNKVKRIINFFAMSKEDMVEAGIDLSDQHVAYDQNTDEIQSDTPATSKQYGRIL